MKRMLIAALSLAVIVACGLPSTDNINIEPGATPSPVAAPPTQEQPPTLMPVPTLTLVPSVNTPDPATATRIQFGANGVTATVSGAVTAPERTTYVLFAFGTQHMYVELASPDNAANYSVSSATNGMALKPLDDANRQWNGVLPANDDYLISVAVQNGTTSFTLTVTVLWQ